MAVTERISTGAALTWNAATVLKVVDYEFGGSAPAEDVTGQMDGVGATATLARDYVAGLRELDLFRFTVIYDKLDTVHDALDDDFVAGTRRNVVFTAPDGVIYSFEGAIEELSESMPLGSAMKADIAIMLTDRDTVHAPATTVGI